MDTKEFIKTVNALRLENKGKWYQWHGEVDGKQVSLKGHNTWIQRLSVDSVWRGSSMDMNVKDFKEFLHLCVN